MQGVSNICKMNSVFMVTSYSGNKVLFVYFIHKNSYKSLLFYHRYGKGAFIEPQGKSTLINAALQGNATLIVLYLSYRGQLLGASG